MKKYKRRLGDRSDGRKVRWADPLMRIVPHIMRSRLDCQVHFEEEFDLEPLEEFIHRMRRTEIPNLSLLNVICAAVVRTISQRPHLNRFVAGNNVYARNYVRISLAVKKQMTEEAEETTIMPEFNVTDTLYDVCKTLHKDIDESKIKEDNVNTENKTDSLVKILNYLPNFILKFIVFTVRNLDKIGLCPKFIRNVSPFHSSVFITDVGSLAISSVYHHLYEFGTCSIFVAMGGKDYKVVQNSNGEFEKKKILKLKFVVDERICDGFYYSRSIRILRRILKNPQWLLEPPEQVVYDSLK